MYEMIHLYMSCGHDDLIQIRLNFEDLGLYLWGGIDRLLTTLYRFYLYHYRVPTSFRKAFSVN